MSKLTNVIDKFYHDMAITDLRIMNSELNESKLTYNSILYLDIVMARQGEYTASQLADLLHVARPAVTQKINELEKMDLIKKVQCSNDKRKFYLYSNMEAFPKKMEYNKGDEFVESELKSVYSKEELDKFCEMLEFIGKSYLESRSK